MIPRVPPMKSPAGMTKSRSNQACWDNIHLQEMQDLVKQFQWQVNEQIQNAGPCMGQLTYIL